MKSSVLDFFSHFALKTVEQPLYDYGGLHCSVAPYPVFYPQNIEQLQEMVRICGENKICIRLRASGHTFNGCSLPRSNELLVRPDFLDSFAFNAPGTVDVGAGSVVWDIRDLVNDYGFDLPVCNGGWAGPTLGGYISAGGFGQGKSSATHGGLWENIDGIVLVNGSAKICEILNSDSRFPWLFGSYGQLGLIAQARLKLIPLKRNPTPDYPLGRKGKVARRQKTDPKEHDSRPDEEIRRLFWFSLLVSPEKEGRGWADLAKFARQFPNEIKPEGGWMGPLIGGQPIGCFYSILHKNFHPPLIYPRQETFYVMALLARLPTGETNRQRTLEIEHYFIELARNSGHRLYLQAENIGRTIHLPDYYGPQTFEKFLELKAEFDPKDLFNPGLFQNRTLSSPTQPALGNRL